MRAQFLSAGALLLVVALAGCSRRSETLDRLRLIGAATFEDEAARLAGTTASEHREVPSSAWPRAIRELTPEAVTVADGGVYIRIQHSFVEETGLFVALEGTKVITGPGHDPSFEQVAQRIFWYKVKG